LIGTGGERRGDVGDIVPEVGRGVDLAVGEVVELVAITDDRRPQDDRDRPNDDVCAGPDKLEKR